MEGGREAVEGGTMTIGLGGEANPEGVGLQTDWSPSSVAGSLGPPVADHKGEGVGTTKTMLMTTGEAVTTFAAGDRSRVKQ
jgi:hypothetical protein